MADSNINGGEVCEHGTPLAVPCNKCDGGAKVRAWGTNCTLAEYHASPAISTTKLTDFKDDPRLYVYRHQSGDYVEKPKAHFDKGAMVHAMLASETLDEFVRIPEDVLSKSGSKAGNKWKEFAAANKDKRLLKAAEWHACAACVKAVAEHPAAGKLLSAKGFYERTFRAIFNDQPTQCRPDKILPLLTLGPNWVDVVDFKTTGDQLTSPAAFVQAVKRGRYHWCETFTRFVLELCGFNVRNYTFVFVSIEKPNLVDCFRLGPRFQELGNVEVERRLKEITAGASLCAKARNEVIYHQVEPPQYMIRDDYDL